MYVVCAFLLIFMCSTTASISGKAFLCRDPDTGKFHEVNTTWPSSTFCGNYHCKLRKKNITETEYVPIREMNISDNDLQTRITKKEVFEKDIQLNKEAPKTEKNNSIVIINSSDSSFKDILKDLRQEDRDRYLNEKEIKSIASILHTIKKSDLDAIIEIYNLAKDIYKEIDETSSNNIVPKDGYSKKSDVSIKSKDNMLAIDKMKKISYWYEPIAETTNDKQRQFDIAPGDMHSLDTINIKLSTLEDLKTTTAKPVIKTTNSMHISTETKGDITKLPYYPLSAFQTLSSYTQQTGTHKSPYVYTDSTTSTQKPQKESINYKKNINPSYFLSYPFLYIPQYNLTYPQNIFYYNQLEYQNENLKMPLQKPALEKAQAKSMKTANKTEKKKESPKKMYITEIRPKTKYEYDWQTDPLSAQILSEVRANADKKLLKPLSLRKKVNLERVGKVLKTDAITNRSKRSVAEESNLEFDIYEVYLEKTMCHTDPSVPGYFIYGNMSKPFPDCCPERKS